MPEIYIFTEVWDDEAGEWELADFQLEEEQDGLFIYDTTQQLPGSEDAGNEENPWLMAMLSDCEDAPEGWAVDATKYGGVIDHEDEMPADLSPLLRGYVDDMYSEEDGHPGSPSVVELSDIESRNLSRFDADFGDFFESLIGFLREKYGDARIRLVCWHT